MAIRKASTAAETDWIRRLAEIREDFAVPGFFQSLGQNAESWAKEISVSPFWRTAGDRLAQWRTEYSSSVASTSAPSLLPKPGLPDFEPKPESSIKNKLERLCASKPAELAELVPAGGPPIPRMNDLVRTRVSCSYIDGVDFLAERLTALAEEMGCEPELSREGRIEGYFAQHLTLNHSVIYRFAGNEEMATIRCEIQLASQLATQVWHASHPLYEQVRGRTNAPSDWQWRPTDLRFTANQLGHMIHLADGLLVQLRDKRT